MPLNIFEAAKNVCERANWRLSNLELQKVLYLAQLRYKRAHRGKRLIDTQFEAWDYGPVSPSIYHAMKVFGSDPVKNVFYSTSTNSRDLDGDLNASVDLLVGKSPAELVALTHRSGGAWAKYYHPGIRGIRIPDTAIDEEAIRFATP